MKARENLRILLIQARHDNVTILEELKEFARFSRLGERQFDLFNVFRTPFFDPDVVDQYDAVFIGGSSDASVCQPENYPFVKDCGRLLAYCIDQEIPVFASCFGFQIVTVACGGKVITDTAQQEMGIFPVHLTPEADHDPLLHDLPNPFWVVSGHKDRAVQLPTGFTNLAFSELCPFHLLRIDGKPFYGTQFHPEMNHEDFVSRITRYRDRYDLEEDDIAHISISHHDTPESNALIGHFIDRIVLSQEWKATERSISKM